MQIHGMASNGSLPAIDLDVDGAISHLARDARQAKDAGSLARPRTPDLRRGVSGGGVEGLAGLLRRAK